MDVRIKELEKEVKNLSAKQGICEWVTNNEKCCKKPSSVFVNGHKFCSKHEYLVKNFNICEDQEICDTYSNIKLVPRSYEQVKFFMKSVKNQDNTVDVYVSKGCIEEGDISDKTCITLTSDDCNFYYTPKRGENKAKNLRILLRNYCSKKCDIIVEDVKYCKECYEKLKNAPIFSLIEKNDD